MRFQIFGFTRLQSTESRRQRASTGSVYFLSLFIFVRLVLGVCLATKKVVESFRCHQSILKQDRHRPPPPQSSSSKQAVTSVGHFRTEQDFHHGMRCVYTSSSDSGFRAGCFPGTGLIGKLVLQFCPSDANHRIFSNLTSNSISPSLLVV